MPWYNAAVNVADYFLANAGITLKVMSDKKKEVTHEILVGEGNRVDNTEIAKFIASIFGSDHFGA